MGKSKTEILERYADGELSRGKMDKVAKMVQTSPESQLLLDKNRQIGDLVRFSNEELTKGVSFDGFADRVIAEINSSKASLSLPERLKAWFSEFFEHRKAVWIPAAAVGAAAALALFLLPLSNVPSTQSDYVSGGNGITLHAASKGIEGSTIASVDFGGEEGRTYSLRSKTGGTVGVVWIEEKP